MNLRILYNRILTVGWVLCAVLPATVTGADPAISKPAAVKSPPGEIQFLLIANLRDVEGKITTDTGTQGTKFRGQLAFRVLREAEGGHQVSVERLNLLGNPVSTTKGETGVIGLSLQQAEKASSRAASEGVVTAKVRMMLHYPLIDKLKGFRSKGGKGDMNFVPFTESMSGILQGKLKGFRSEAEKGDMRLVPFTDSMVGALEEELRADPSIKKNVGAKFEGRLELSTDNGDPSLVTNLMLGLSIEDMLVALGLEESEVLYFQHVFIGTGPRDITATGAGFDTMIRRAAEMWSRCGTERCLRIVAAGEPIYIDDDSYRVIDNDAEAFALAAEVDVPDAVEIFVAEKFVEAVAVDWGGGGTIGSGTASAKIVTSDQNLDVPCPAPCDANSMCSSPSCGDVNYCHLAHELGHVVNLDHPSGAYGLASSTAGSVMEPSGFCCDNPDSQSAQNCRNASNPLLFWGRSVCTGTPDIDD